VVSSHSDTSWDKQRRVDGNHDAIDSVEIDRFAGFPLPVGLVEPYQNVLKGREYDEAPEQGSMVAAASRGHRDELAKCPKRNQGEEHDDSGWVKHESENNEQDDDPPSSQP